MKKNVRIISIFSLFLACFLLFFACGSGTEFTGTSSSTTSAPSPDCLHCHGNAKPTDSLSLITDDIIDTHYDDWRIDENGDFVTDATSLIEGYLFESPLSWAADGVGYFVRTGTASDCAHSCHDWHNRSNKKNRQWRSSGHANINAEAFTHDFDDSNGVCMRCHSGAGYASYVSPSNTSYPGWNAPTSGVHPGLITCNSCHDGQERPSNDNLRLRKTGTVTLTSGSGSRAVNDATIDAGNSATCITCHQFRESGGSVYKYITQKLSDEGQTGVDPYAYGSDMTASFNFGTLNSHYLGAGAMLYGLKGFEYKGKSYTPGNPFHQTQGCVGCHMFESDDEELGGHTFNIINHHLGKEHTAVCEQCHGPVESFESIGTLKDMDCDGNLEHVADEINGLKSRVQNELANRDIYFGSGYPYFFTSATSQSFGTANTNWKVGEIEAAFNLQFVDKDPGAFVHNFRYAAQLLRDSYEALTGTPLTCTRPSTGDDRPATEYN